MKHGNAGLGADRADRRTGTGHGRGIMPWRRFGAAGILLVAALAMRAAPGLANTGQICDQAARNAAALTDVPLAVLQSITRTETGRARDGGLHPWPWTVNMEGEGRWFETRDAAHAYVEQALRRGARSFDVGCFQINYRWHGDAFGSLHAMFDPMENALYAARFLSRLHSETGDWSLAAGAYHSRTPEHARTYRARFERIRAGLRTGPVASAGTGTAVTGSSDAGTANSFPLLQMPQARPAFGSLVPLDRVPGRALIALARGEERS